MRLSALLAGLAAVRAADDREVTGLASDSREVSPGDLFFACAGHRVHGGAYIAEAVRNGAVAVACDGDGNARAEWSPAVAGVPVVPVPALGERLGVIAARFHGAPSRDLNVIGVTGTNGKTSCCHYLAQALNDGARPCGVIGTLGYGPLGALRPGRHTTPDALTLQGELARMRDMGTRHVVMEVSSHALAQGRTAGVAFDGAVFTNLSHDHLDYHGDLDAYARSKQRLFTVQGLKFAAINLDDPYGRALISGLSGTVSGVGYGLSEEARGAAPGAHVWGRILRADVTGLELEIDSSWGAGRLRSALLGRFNASNLLAALAMLLLLGKPLPQALEALSAARAVPGRMERFSAAGRPLVVVDYAHTPDALHQALAALRDHCAGRLWCVFGCGGDRDRAKRPLMGAVAERCADRVIVTDDNPRHEDPQAITAQILAGMASRDKVEVVADRALAIERAVRGAGEADVVLIAGKGHEDCQQVGEQRRPFSDRAQVERLLRGSPRG